MPHLSPFNWLILFFLFSLIVSISLSSTWWFQFPKMQMLFTSCMKKFPLWLW